ncbi:MAG: ferritin-like domain-containing protein [Burkholderiales bacterium]
MPQSIIRDTVAVTRRNFVGHASSVLLSASAIALMSGCESVARSDHKSESQDVAILNTALGLEHEAISAYQLGAESGLLQKPVLDVAVQFQSHHKAHRDALIATIRKLGGRPVDAMALSAYAKALKVELLKSQADVLALAAKLELGATNAYLGVIPSFQSNELAKVSARLAADETMHWTVLSQALGRALPTGALSFGA